MPVSIQAKICVQTTGTERFPPTSALGFAMSLFPNSPQLHCHDPLGVFLGITESGAYTYTFDDVVKLSGHACPTVAGAFLLVLVALSRLYPGQIPERGDLSITLPGTADTGVNGPMGQVFTLLTGAAGENGFKGLGGRFVRRGLLHHDPMASAGIRFQRLSTGASVILTYDPGPIPPHGEMGGDLQRLLHGDDDEETARRFGLHWRARVDAILADGGRSTIRELS